MRCRTRCCWCCVGTAPKKDRGDSRTKNCPDRAKIRWLINSWWWTALSAWKLHVLYENLKLLWHFYKYMLSCLYRIFLCTLYMYFLPIYQCLFNFISVRFFSILQCALWIFFSGFYFLFYFFPDYYTTPEIFHATMQVQFLLMPYYFRLRIASCTIAVVKKSFFHIFFLYRSIINVFGVFLNHMWGTFI